MRADDQIRRTLGLYSQCLDRDTAEAFARLFAEDAVFSAPTWQVTGRPAIKQWALDHRDPHKRHLHLCGNSVISIEGRTASAMTDVVVFERDGDSPWEIHTVGQYDDRFVEQDGDWLFAERRILKEGALVGSPLGALRS